MRIIYNLLSLVEISPVPLEDGVPQVFCLQGTGGRSD
jgi:hypothetical protein